MMKVNPWLNIPIRDYEGHMEEVGQLQLMSQIMAHIIRKYKPSCPAVLGCASGNGFEHFNYPEIEKVIGVDISADYLNKLKKRFETSLPSLELFELNLLEDSLPFKGVDCYFLFLILEYVSPKILLPKLKSTMGKEGRVVILIQENISSTFVSKTVYQSLEQLDTIACLIDHNQLIEQMLKENYSLEDLKEYPCGKGKQMIMLGFKLN